MNEKISGQPQQPDSNVINVEAERRRLEERREYFRKSRQEARKEFRKGMIQTALFIGIPLFVAPIALGTVNHFLDKKKVSEPVGIEATEQGNKSHHHSVPEVPFH